MKVKKAAPNVKAKQMAAAMERCERIRGGRVARSPSMNCEMIKMIVSTPNPTRRPMMRELFQGYVEPPH